MEIIKLSPIDIDKFVQLILVFADVFEMQNFTIPKQEHLVHNLGKSDFIVFVAQKDDCIIGGLTAYTLHSYYSEKPLAYIYDLAIQTHYQRQGIGKKLIAAIKMYCQENNYEEVFVQADKVDGYALDFYRATKPTDEEQVVHFYYTLG
ncbi:GNAT family N-acetyltransferase [Adhaeribacter pallidiroseus]|uniref:Gentamicin 3-N-acetyltransferase n=1 Tax=Adhaeribacter pallidiroseus TaxID=2072847 RepID=A0A369QKN9_9BACT|nr:GNAT family N-acetyltransferase [Adhaeribacter pallidiroseus]RDC64952.1 Gentamicin 3-N-acetyltransferase [Adhaeribacter pallidiroseus]